MFSKFRTTLHSRQSFVALTITTVLLVLISASYLKFGSKNEPRRVHTHSPRELNQADDSAMVAVHRPTEVNLFGKNHTFASTTRKTTTRRPRDKSATTLPPLINQNARRTAAPVASNADHLASLVPRVFSRDINCAKLIDGNKAEIKTGQEFQKANPKVKVPDDAYIKLASNCDNYRKSRQYVMEPLSQEEEDFPLAYSIMMFKDVEQTERLLRAIYRPQNYYCIHVDIKSPPVVHKAMKSIASCFDNVFLAHKKVDVQWAWFSVLEPDLVCMEDLFKYKKWRYFINLTGQEWPLKTNWDLVKILKVYNGAIDMEGTVKR